LDGTRSVSRCRYLNVSRLTSALLVQSSLMMNTIWNPFSQQGSSPQISNLPLPPQSYLPSTTNPFGPPRSPIPLLRPEYGPLLAENNEAPFRDDYVESNRERAGLEEAAASQCAGSNSVEYSDDFGTRLRKLEATVEAQDTFNRIHLSGSGILEQNFQKRLQPLSLGNTKRDRGIMWVTLFCQKRLYPTCVALVGKISLLEHKIREYQEKFDKLEREIGQLRQELQNCQGWSIASTSDRE
jgi:hypothetical protein